jgi:hypothetical protein
VGFVLYLLAKNPVAQNKLLFELRDEKVGASWAKGTVLHQLGKRDGLTPVWLKDSLTPTGLWGQSDTSSAKGTVSRNCWAKGTVGHQSG